MLPFLSGEAPHIVEAAEILVERPGRGAVLAGRCENDAIGYRQRVTEAQECPRRSRRLSSWLGSPISARRRADARKTPLKAGKPGVPGTAVWGPEDGSTRLTSRSSAGQRWRTCQRPGYPLINDPARWNDSGCRGGRRRPGTERRGGSCDRSRGAVSTRIREMYRGSRSRREHRSGHAETSRGGGATGRIQGRTSGARRSGSAHRRGSG